MVGIVKGLEERDWNVIYLGRRGVLLYVGHELLSQVNVELSQLVVTGVVGPHGCKYLADRSNLLIYRPLLDGAPCGCQDS